MITGTQIALHLLGDYVTQSDWMADNKTKRFWPAAAHAMAYSAPFAALCSSLWAFQFILLSHFLIDRYRLARFVVRWKNTYLSPDWSADRFRTDTGYPDAKPAWLSVWLLIAADNTLHLFCNGFAIAYL